MTAVWQFLNGKKTVIGAVLAGIDVALRQAGYGQIADVVGPLAQVLLAAGLAHKAVKADN